MRSIKSTEKICVGVKALADKVAESIQQLLFSRVFGAWVLAKP